jgi:hypothetical protein
VFCGYCGTPLTFWTEEPREEADFMSIAIGSLLAEDQRALDELDLLPDDFDEEAPRAGVSTSTTLAPAEDPTSSVIIPSFEEPKISRSFQHGTTRGIPWFEEMVEGSRLGRLMRSRRGKGVSDDKSTSVEWEISEWHDDGSVFIRQESESSGGSTGKRKRVTQVETEEAGSPSKRVE